MRPVVNGGDAGIRQLDKPEHDAGVEIIWLVERRSRILRREIAEAAVADEVAAERAPHVVVRIHKARHDNHVGGIDYSAPAGARSGPIPSILPSRTKTSARGRTPCAGSTVMTAPFLMR